MPYTLDYLSAPQGGRRQNSTFYSTDGSATHASHFGMGGYMEVPNIAALYSIPTYISVDLNTDGISSGRRKYGMIVYVIEENKYYQLLPRFKDTKKIIPWELFVSLPPKFRLVLIDPSIGFTVSNEGEDSYFTWVGLQASFPDYYSSLLGYSWRINADLDEDGIVDVEFFDGVVVGQGGAYFDTGYTVTPYGGLANPSDAWTEVFVKGNFANIGDLNLYATGNAAAYAGQICSTLDTNSVYVLDSGLSPLAIGGGGGDDLLNDDLTVLGVSIGSYSDGQTITKDTSLETIIKNMLQKRIPPTYVQPAFSISTDITSSYEIGTSISPKIMGSWTQNNAGPLKEYIIYKDSSLVFGPSSALPLTHFTDSSFVLSSVTSYSATAEWFDGAVLDDNMSDPYPVGQIQNNAGNPKASNVITFTPKRAVFYTADTATSAPTTSSQIRAFTSRIDIGNGSTFTISIGTSVKRVVIAYLKSYGPITSVKDSGNSYDVKGSFGIPAEISVLGANGFTGETYYVYTYLLGNSYSSPVTYTVTI